MGLTSFNHFLSNAGDITLLLPASLFDLGMSNISYYGIRGGQEDALNIITVYYGRISTPFNR